MESQNSIQRPEPLPASVVRNVQLPNQHNRCGNGMVLEDLVSEHRERVLRHCSRRGLDPSDAADVSQEVFIKVMRSLHRFENRYPFTTWLYRITENAIIDHIRRRSHHRDLIVSNRTEDGGEIEFPTTQYDPENNYRLTELQENITSALERLPAIQRQALEMKEFEGLTYGEIAEVVQCPKETVKSRIYRARVILNRRMAHLI